MTQEHRKYIRGEKVKRDKEQMMFSFSGSLKSNPNIVVVAHTTVLPLEKQVSCPFCLGLSDFRKFLVSNKQGISTSMGKCRLCGQGMFLRSLKLMSETNAVGYTRWVFAYKGFWKKINFHVWKGRLQLIGWTQEFWDEYKRLKGEAQKEGQTDKGFIDYINRKGQEQAEEWNKQYREMQ